MQRRAMLWIVGAFCTSLTTGIEAIASLISIHLYIQKLNSRFHLRVYSLPANYIINSILEVRSMNYINPYYFSLE